MGELKVYDLMSTDVLTIDARDNLEEAEQTMEAGRVHHLPVVSRGRLVGILTQADLLRAQVSVFAELSAAEELSIKQSIPVFKVMTRKVSTVTAETPARRAGEILRRHKYGCLPVVTGNRLVGIVTEGDFISLVIRALTTEPETEFAAYA